jgi:hypothetical protein
MRPDEQDVARHEPSTLSTSLRRNGTLADILVLCAHVRDSRTTAASSRSMRGMEWTLRENGATVSC